MDASFRRKCSHWKAVLRALPGWHVLVDLSGRVQWISPTLREKLRVSQEDYQDKGLSTLFSFYDASQQPLQVFSRDEAQTLRAKSGSFWLKLAKGSRQWVSLSVSPLMESLSGKQEAFLVSIQPQAKASGSQIEQADMELMRVIAGGIAHDLNNLLTAVIGHLSLMKTKLPEDSEGKKNLANALNASNRAQILTKEFLSFSKEQKNREPESIDLGAFLKEYSDFILGPRKVPCVFEFDPKLWNAFVPRNVLSQIMSNLLVNAAQAIRPGGKVYLEAHNHTQTQPSKRLKRGDYVHVVCRDEGVGISEANLKKIFSAYYTTKKEGSGLGLATCKSLIKDVEGAMHVSSQLGKGTQFDLYFPSNGESESIDENDAQAMTAESTKGHQPNRLEVTSNLGSESGKNVSLNQIKRIKPKEKPRILVLDDEAVIQQICGDMLEHLGYQPSFADDGDQALELFMASKRSGSPFDLLILDLAIPGGKGGREIIQPLLSEDPDVKALVSSGYINDPIMEDFQAYGFTGKLSKPYSLEQLSQVLSQLIGKMD